MKGNQQMLWRSFVGATLTASMMLLTACNGGTTTTPTQAENTSSATYTVTLDPNGGTFTDGGEEAVTIQVQEGTAIDFASYMPEYEGNTLYGWYLEDGSPWPGARKVSGDLSLKAKWSVAEEDVVYDLVLTIDGVPVTMEYDNGVYQFTQVSSIYGGYAQRSAQYTIHMDDLKAAMEADDGTVQRVLYKAESNYVDATGTIYGEFYNDGEFELYYDYDSGDGPTKYCMETGYWTYVDYTAPFENTPLPEHFFYEDRDMGYTSAHLEWDTSLLSAQNDEGQEGQSEGGSEQESGDGETTTEIATLPGPVIYTADATESETMKANFSANGVMAIYMTTYDVNVDAKYLWSYDEENGFALTYNGSEENIATDQGDGTYSFSDNMGNDYAMDLSQLLAAKPEAEQICTAAATVSETMFVFFYDDQSLSVMFDLTAYGMAGQYSAVATGQWSWSEEEGLALAVAGQVVELADQGDGTVQFTVQDNTYSVTVAELSAAMN